MKRIILAVFASNALAACGPGDARDTAVSPETVETTTTVNTAPSDLTGTYEVTTSDGTIIRQTINSDGTYVDIGPDGTVNERGSWYQAGQQMCFDPEGNDPETCYDGGTVSADDSFDIRERGGNFTASVRKIEDETASDDRSSE